MIHLKMKINYKCIKHKNNTRLAEKKFEKKKQSYDGIMKAEQVDIEVLGSIKLFCHKFNGKLDNFDASREMCYRFYVFFYFAENQMNLLVHVCFIEC